MTAPRFFGLRRVLRVAAGLLLAGACSTPDIKFGKPPADAEPSCDDGARDGTETGEDCGGSCPPCDDGEGCADGSDCESKVCKDEHCASATCSDGVINQDELDRDCGGAHCDGCGVGSPCETASGCEMGLCDEETHTCALNCPSGTDECDGNTDEPCEANLRGSPENCGECGHACNLPNTVPSCSGGVCQISECVEPFRHCSTDMTGGCETNIGNDAKNCGGCGMECPAVNGTPRCVNGECQIECEGDFDDCDEDPLTGCESSIASDVNNCGSCKHKCPDTAGETSYCNEDGCGSSVCPKGFGNCNGKPSDDCEQSLTDDIMHCGRCGGLCTVSRGEPDCEDSECAVKSCEEGWENCNTDAEDGGYSDGCEANLMENPEHCGACGVVCDVENGMGLCQYGQCVVSSCTDGFEDCDKGTEGGFENGCETDLASDPNHCGSCEVACDLLNATPKCVSSACQVDHCNGGFGDCTAAEGCETDVTNNPQHCGGCGAGDVCSKDGATDSSCEDSECGPPSCDGTHGNCDGSTPAAYANGCETALNSPLSCGDSCAELVTCGGTTPACRNSGGGWQCEAAIVAGTPVFGASQATANPQASFTHTLTDGEDRVVLVAVASRSTSTNAGTGIVEARPSVVTYAGVTMTKFGEAEGPQTDAPQLYYYYLTDSSPALDAPGAKAVVVRGTVTGGTPGIIAVALQFTGVNQTTPILTSGKSTAGQDTQITNTVSTTVSGTMSFALAAAQYVGTTTASPVGMTSVMDTTITNSTQLMRAVAARSGSLVPGSSTFAWKWQWSQKSNEFVVVLNPASNP